MSLSIIQRSFAAVKEDILSFKHLVQQWFSYTQYRVDLQDYKMAMLEQRIANLEESMAESREDVRQVRIRQ